MKLRRQQRCDNAGHVGGQLSIRDGRQTGTRSRRSGPARSVYHATAGRPVDRRAVRQREVRHDQRFSGRRRAPFPPNKFTYGPGDETVDQADSRLRMPSIRGFSARTPVA